MMTTDYAHGTTQEAELDNTITPKIQEPNHTLDTNLQRGSINTLEEELIFATRAKAIAATAEGHVIHTQYITIWGFRNGISVEQVLSEIAYIADNAGLTSTDSLKNCIDRHEPWQMFCNDECFGVCVECAENIHFKTVYHYDMPAHMQPTYMQRGGQKITIGEQQPSYAKYHIQYSLYPPEW